MCGFFSIIRFLVDVPQWQRFQPNPLPNQLLDFIEDEEVQQEEQNSENEEDEGLENLDDSGTQHGADADK